jgi:CheY-like chemotaxis protein
VRLRCSHCEAVFRVRPPIEEAKPAAVQTPPAEPTSVETTKADRERLILVADAEVELGKLTANALVDWGLQPTLVHDGVEAIMTIQRLLPRAIVIDAALPRMFGFQICELVKRNESLQHIQVVLIGAIHNGSRYRRPPGEIYGADAYIERPDLPAGLRAILQDFGMLAESTPTPTSSISQPGPRPTPASTPKPNARPLSAPSATPERIEPAPSIAPPAPAPHVDPLGEEIARAERLARIIVSDIVLYNQEKFEAALRTGDVVGAMTAELAEGRSLFVARIDPSLREQRDFLAEELRRVAAQRSDP